MQPVPAQKQTPGANIVRIPDIPDDWRVRTVDATDAFSLLQGHGVSRRPRSQISIGLPASSRRSAAIGT